MSSKKIILVSLVLLTLASRFAGLNWGQGYYFHPDENNLAHALLDLSHGQINFFAYGQLPLFLSLAGLKSYHLFRPGTINFTEAIFALRIISALSASLSVGLIFLLAKKIFKSFPAATITTILAIATPGLIQAAHFGTPAALLIFFNLAIVYFSWGFWQTERLKFLLAAGLAVGLAAGTKISGLIFLTTPTLVLISKKIKGKPNWQQLAGHTFLLLLVTGGVAILASPYHLLKFSQARQAIRYELNIASGKAPVFYTRQFINTTPYIFPMVKIFPYVWGLPLLILAGLGLRQLKHFPPFLKIISLSGWLYFAYFGQVFVKWTRFFAPLFFLAAFWATVWLKKQKLIRQYCFIILACLPGVIFFYQVYLTADVRLKASGWIKKNIPKKTTILTENHNPVTLPLENTADYQIITFDFYSLEKDGQENQLQQKLKKADYFLIPNRRVFANHLRLKNRFPKTARFYKKLFAQNTEFAPVKIIRPPLTWLYPAEQAEETWSVFDHPTVRFYQKR